MKRIIVLVLSLILLFVCGCGEKVTENSISVSNSFEITEVTVEDATEDVDLDEMKETIEKEISDYYITTMGKAVELKDLYEEDGRIITELEYGKYDVYNAYNNKNLYVGSIHNAFEIEDNTYFYDVVFLSAKDNKEVKVVDVIENTGDRVVIFEDDYIYHVGGKICYISENVELVDKKSARLKNGESGLGYIIYK